jgi:hypothetical protein
LDVGHFAFVHVETFGDRTDPEVPSYTVKPTANGFQADYLSTVSNYPKRLKHLNPTGFKWRRLFDVFFALHSQTISLFSERWSAAYSQRSVSSLGPEDACVCAYLSQFR